MKDLREGHMDGREVDTETQVNENQGGDRRDGQGKRYKRQNLVLFFY